MINKAIYRSCLVLTVLISGLVFNGCEDKSQQDSSFIALVVSDFDRSMEWYTNTFGFEVLNKTENADRGLKQANLKLGPVKLEIIELNSSIHASSLLDSTQNRVIFQGIFKAGFTIDEFEQKVSAWHDDKIVTKDQVVTDPVSGSRMVILRDPDGNRIQIFEKQSE